MRTTKEISPFVEGTGFAGHDFLRWAIFARIRASMIIQCSIDCSTKMIELVFFTQNFERVYQDATTTKISAHSTRGIDTPTSSSQPGQKPPMDQSPDGSFFVSATYSMRSPGWQSRYSHSRSMVRVSICPPSWIFANAAWPIILFFLIVYVVIPRSLKRIIAFS